MDENILVSAGTSLAMNLLSGGCKAPAQTIDNIWNYVFGPINEYLIKKDVQRQHNIEMFKKELDAKVSSIPTEHLQEPKLSILGPLLEASKYYIDEKEIRDMFSNLTAAACDNRNANTVHHAFVEIIKQMNPIDAQAFKSLKDNPSYLITCIVKTGTSNDLLFQNILINETFPDYIGGVSIGLSNLSRLGLIKITDNLGTVKIGSEHEKELNAYHKTSHYSALCQEYGKSSLTVFTQPCHITTMGFVFKKICLNEEL